MGPQGPGSQGPLGGPQGPGPQGPRGDHKGPAPMANPLKRVNFAEHKLNGTWPYIYTYASDYVYAYTYTFIYGAYMYILTCILYINIYV